jgi:hypothetical protein
MGSVNLAVLRREITAQASKSIETRANKVLENAYNKERDKFLQEFDAHPVTQSLENGPKGNDGIVNTAKGGNLYSLIGFKGNSNPIAALRKILFNRFRLRGKLTTKLVGNKIIVERTAESPSLIEIDKQTSGKYGVGDWTNKSWVRLIEDGIPWFRAYLFGEKYSKWSRSGTAIEAKDKEGNLVTARNESFGPIPYLSVLLRRFRERIRK